MDDFGRSNQTVTLRDGRKLGFADYGPQSGTPVMLFGGASGPLFEAVQCMRC